MHPQSLTGTSTRHTRGHSFLSLFSMATTEALRSDAPVTGQWPEGLPADGTELARELDALQQCRFERYGLRGGALPEIIGETLRELRKLTYLQSPFPPEIAPALQEDLARLHEYYGG